MNNPSGPRFVWNPRLVKAGQDLLRRMLARGLDRAEFSEDWPGLALQLACSRPEDGMTSIPVPRDLEPHLHGPRAYLCFVRQQRRHG